MQTNKIIVGDAVDILRNIVLDPFIGSGTTASVAIEEGRNYIGIDVNPDYVALANKRIETAASAAAQKGVMK